MKKKCFIVRHSNYAEGSDYYVFWSEEAAQKCISADVQTEKTNLADSGYDFQVSERDGYIEIYVPDTGIYYEWELISSTIE